MSALEVSSRDSVSSLPYYDMGCAAIEKAKTLDEAKNIQDKAEAVRAYARQTKNRNLELDALEIRVRAERRLGEMIGELRRTKKLKTTKRRYPKCGKIEAAIGNKGGTIHLPDIGLSRVEQQGCEKLARVPIEQFERNLGEWRGRYGGGGRVGMIARPLKEIKRPASFDYEERIRKKQSYVDMSDPFDKFRMLDGRCIGDVLFDVVPSCIRRAKREIALLEIVLQRVATACPGAKVRDVIKASDLESVENELRRETLCPMTP